MDGKLYIFVFFLLIHGLTVKINSYQVLVIFIYDNIVPHKSFFFHYYLFFAIIYGYKFHILHTPNNSPG